MALRIFALETNFKNAVHDPIGVSEFSSYEIEL